MSVYLEGLIYGPLTQREASLVERAYMGALVAKQILASIESRYDEFLPAKANAATHDKSQDPTEAEIREWGSMKYWQMREHDKAAGGKG